MRRPSATFDWCTAYKHLRRHTVFNGGSVNKRFVGRAGLSQSLRGIIELACVKIIPTNHRYDFAVMGIDRNYRCLDLRHLRKFDLQHLV